MGVLHTTKVLTTGGFVPASSINVGDEVIGVDTKPMTVASVARRPAPLGEFEVDGGAVVTCSKDQKFTLMQDTTQDMACLTVEELLSEDDPTAYISPVIESPIEFYGEKADLVGPEFMALALTYPDPSKGFLSLATSDPQDLNRYLPTLPAYALAYADYLPVMTFVYTEDSLVDDPYMPLLQEAHLLGGNYNEFFIPDAYAKAPADLRGSLVLFMAYPYLPEDVEEINLTALLRHVPYHHPTYGDTLKEMVWSLGWPLDGVSRRVGHVRDLGMEGDVIDFTFEGPNSLYLVDNYLVVGEAGE